MASEVIDQEETEVTAKPAKDADGVPYCVVHHCRMKQASGGRKNSPTAYYSCPVPGCDEKAKRIKTPNESVVPPHPQRCPRCPGKKPVFCERDANNSTAASTILQCPQCGWRSAAMARPELAAAHLAQRQRPPVADIGDR